MEIRKAQEKDIDKLLILLSEVLEIHASIRPDIFISGKTKYTKDMLLKMVYDLNNPIYVVYDKDVIAYAFCQLKDSPFVTNMYKHKIFFVDDLCVDKKQRGKGIGKLLFTFLKAEAKRRGCYEISLNVWNGNASAIAFYEKIGMQVKEYNMEYIL